MSGGSVLSELEIDAIGEIMNISMGSAATAASTVLENKVTITAPVVKIIETEQLEMSAFEPAIGVEIRYVEGISGSNIMILRLDDCKAILAQMMQTELSEDYIIDEMATSAICELMNQMMGSSATALSCFLGHTVNISTPNVIPIEKFDDFRQKHIPAHTDIMTVKFSISIVDILESEFVSIIEMALAK